jgi:formylglycine-generating enzyme required for sulfatase activity
MVLLPDGTAMGTTFVTVAEWTPFAAEDGIEAAPGCYVRNETDWTFDEARGWTDPGFDQQPDQPVVCVSWTEATAFADWISTKTGKSYRLPTYEESVAAAKAGTTTKFWWGEDFGQVCAHANAADARYGTAYPQDSRELVPCDDGHAFTSPVRAFPPNPWGIYDPVGNVWAWTNSCFKGDCSIAIFRGGAWTDPYDIYYDAAGFWQDRIVLRNYSIGFRIMRDPD